ncbi:MAG: hypothetical protein JW723_12970 [Bacteroidales bacterium]|nr:hypothetical protein [Bacteroidales bacterium]
MLLRLFRSNRSLVILVLPLFIIAIWLPGFQKQDVQLLPFEKYPGILYAIFINFTTGSAVISKILALLLYFIISILIARLNARYFFIPVRTQLPAVIYMFIVSSVTGLQSFNPVVISSLILVVAISNIFGSYKYKGLAYHYFDSALLVSLSSLIYINSFFFISFVWTGLILLRTFNWREWIISIIGLILPYLFLITYFFATGKSINESLINVIIGNFNAGLSLADKIAGIDIIAIVLTVCLIISSLFMMHRFNTKKIHARKYFLFFLWMFIISTFLFISVPSFGTEYILFAAIPLTYLFSHYFVFTKINLFSRIVFSVLILLPFYLVYFDIVCDLIKK